MNCLIHYIIITVTLGWAIIKTNGGDKLTDDRVENLHDILTSYEILHHTDVRKARKKRSTDNNDITEININTLGRKFHLELQKSHDILSPGFRVVSIDKHNKQKIVEDLDLDIYKGKIKDDENSFVQAYFENEGMSENLVATIHTKDDVYVIEPSWRHLPASKNYSMIAYKGSDLKLKDTLRQSYCGLVHPDSDEAAYQSKGEKKLDHDDIARDEDPVHRYRRQANTASTPMKNTCSLLLVADYKFYKHIGQSSRSKTTAYLVSLINRIDQIYRNTVFGNYKDMGFGIKEIHIHEEWSVVSGDDNHYNENKYTWKGRELLEVFSKNNRHKNFCLSHLFTSTRFEAADQGMAFVAFPDIDLWGICAPAENKDGYSIYRNTGWTTSLSRENRRLLTQEATLITAHEFGHNWGSEHDPDYEDCSPNSFSGGKYIMYTYSVLGYDPNNYVFSPCSRRSIGLVLKSRSSKCFSERMTSFCGNALVEAGEECDPGSGSVRDSDLCCTAECKLRPGKQCSDQNDECCSDCMFAHRDKVCHQAQNQSCEDTSKCNGESKTCPPPPHKPNGSPCIGRGQCKNGTCESYCGTISKLSCACDEVENSCKWCCRDNLASVCKPEPDNNDVTVDLPNGMPCIQGYCQNGVCKKQVQDLIQRFRDIIKQLAPNYIVAFMKANIVGTVIILSLLIWIPVSCIVWKVDKRKDQEDKDRRDWFSRYNNTLVRDPRNIRASSRVRHQRRSLTSPKPDPFLQMADNPQ